MSLEYDLYRQQILNFLRTVTIKFLPFAAYMKQSVFDNYGVIIDKDVDNPYYINLAGEYSPYDTPMYVTTVETGEEVLFDKHLKTNFPKTYSLYKVPNQEYFDLCKKYPLQKDLIKSIVYPVASVQAAIQAENLTMIQYDANILHMNERESMIVAINEFLDMYEYRWYYPDYEYEEMAPLAFWGIIWNLLPQVMITQRVINLRTSAVHPVHIWEYLLSNGLSDYRDILTNRQALFLYRNMAYLRQNKGKMSNLKILAEGLLKEIYVSLVGKTILQQTDTGYDDCVTIPEVISEDVVSYAKLDEIELSSYENMTQIINRMYADGLERTCTAEYIEDQTERFGLTESNILPTKLLELKKSAINTSYEDLLCEFVFDSFMYRFASGKLNYTISFVDEISGVKLKLSIGEAIALFHYIYFKNGGINTLIMPTKYAPRIPYKMMKPTVPNTFQFNKDFRYKYRSLIDEDKIMSDIPWDNTSYSNRDDFLNLVGRQFGAMVTHLRNVRSSASTRYSRAMNEYYKDLLFDEVITFELVPPFASCQQWVELHPGISKLIESYEASAFKKQYYWNLVGNIIEQLLPLNDAIFQPFVGTNKDETAYYRGLKNLFIQLCSYNVAFLETSRAKNNYLVDTPWNVNFENIVEESKFRINATELSFNVSANEFTYEQFNLNDSSVYHENHETTKEDIVSSADITDYLKETPYKRIPPSMQQFELSQTGTEVVAIPIGLSVVSDEVFY